MADEYISREAAETLMCDACEYDCTPHKRASGQSLITADDCYHLRDLYNIPAADVVEVVRCIDCENYRGLAECQLIGDCGGTDFFCAWGKRKDEQTDV